MTEATTARTGVQIETNGINVITETPNPDDPTVIDTTFGCPVDFDSIVPGVAPTVSVSGVGRAKTR